MPILTQRALVLAKKETTAGVDAAPTAAANAFYVSDPVFSVDATVLERNVTRASFSNIPSVVGRKLASLTFSVQVHGSGTPATDPKWATLLEACGMLRTAIAAATGVTAGVQFEPNTTGMSTVTLYVYFDGLLHKITGAMGTFQITSDAGQFATIQFTFTGNYIEPVAAAFPANAALQETVPPQVELASLTFGSDSTLVVNSFSFDIANNVVPRSDVNSADGFRNVRIAGRNPTGGIDPETEVSQTFWTTMAASATSTFAMNIGQTAGNQLQISAPAAQIAGIGYADREGLRTYDLSLAFRAGSVAGNDEIKLFFT
jgi:hypothetical protein